MGSPEAQPCKCGLVIDVLGLSLVMVYTVNPLFIPSGSKIETGGLFNLEKRMVIDEFSIKN